MHTVAYAADNVKDKTEHVVNKMLGQEAAGVGLWRVGSIPLFPVGWLLSAEILASLPKD